MNNKFWVFPRFIRRQIQEIEASPALCYYGFCLALIHSLTAFFWRHKAPLVLVNRFDTICWPYLPGCHSFRFENLPAAETLILVYGVAGAAVAILFLQQKIAVAWTGLLLLTAGKFLVLSLDFRLQGNYHYMPLLVQCAFLFVPGRARFLPVLLCLFYFAAGTLKLNPEWLSGMALIKGTPVPQPLLTWLLGSAIILELVAVWGLLFKSRSVFAGALLSVAAFHAFSWHLVGYFYPLTMALLLSVLVFLRYEPRRAHLKKHHYVLFIFFGLAQTVPWWGGGDSALTGEGRAFALDMFDAHSECQSFIFVKSKGVTEEISKPRSDLGIRVHCDPLVFFNEVANVCKSRKEDRDFVNVDWHLLSRRKSDQAFTRIVDERDFCSQAKRYSIWPVNAFIRKSKPGARPVNPENISFVWTAPVPDLGAAGPAPESVTSLFRGDTRRSGAYRLDGKLTPKPVEGWRRTVGNVGIHGASKASPAIDDSGIYLGGDASWFYALRHDGSVKWRFYVSSSDRGIHGTAALDEKFVYFGAYNGRIYKLDKESGVLVWAHQVGDALGASPLLNGDFIYLAVETNAPDGYLAKLRRADGSLVWVSSALGQQTHSSPAFHDGLLILGDNAGFVRAFHDADGARAWEFKTGAEVKSTPLIAGGSVFVTSWDQHLYKLEASSGRIQWKLDMGAASQSSPTLWEAKDLIVAATKQGAIVGVAASDGKLKWKVHGGPDVNNASAALLIGPSGGLFSIGCETKSLCFIDASGALKSKHQLKGKLTGAPVYHGGVLYLSENEPGDLLALKISN